MQPQNPSTPQVDPNSQPQVVYVSRPLEPQPVTISPEVHQKHEESKKNFPKLNLTPGEYVISAVKRHPFGLILIWAISGGIITILLVFIALVSGAGGSVGGLDTQSGSALPLLSIPLLFAVVLVFIGGAIGTFVYRANTFYLTNESVIQHIQTSLFSKKLQTVSLGNIEDASYTQDGIVPHIFGYGSLRLSTEGDETTYRFHYASNPEQQITLLNNAVEAFKHGRPVEG